MWIKCILVVFLAENNKLVLSKMLIRPSSDMFNLRIRMHSRKNREYLQNGSSNPFVKWCNRIFGSFLCRKQLTILLVRADHPKVLLPPLKLPLCSVIYHMCELYSIQYTFNVIVHCITI